MKCSACFHLLFALLLAVFLIPNKSIALEMERLATLSNWLSGSFNSSNQAKQDRSYFNISLETRRVWSDRKDGIWLYVEQALWSTKHKPYRQRIYHLEDLGDKQYVSHIYVLDSAELYINAYNPSKCL